MTERPARVQLTEDGSLTLPLDLVTETVAILAKRGVGKTSTAVVIAEELLAAGLQVVILDPTNAWWGLRATADGGPGGLPIAVIGGPNGDLPLDHTAGELLADVAVEERASLILSLRHLSGGQQRRFVTDFAERLYFRKGEPQHQTPLMLIIDECDAFVPQRVMAEQARTVGAIDTIVRRGRNAGLGCTLISQRSAVVNKDVLSQIEVLVALRTLSPQDRDALDAWIKAHDAHDQRAAFLDSLASLAIGEAWVWSPGWLDLFVRAQIRKRRTFDSSATPKVGEVRALPRALAPVDLAALGAKLAALAERERDDDPAALRRRIADLERQLAERPAPERVAERVEVRVEVPVLPVAEIGRIAAALAQLRKDADEIQALVELLPHGAAEALPSGDITPSPRLSAPPAPPPAPVVAAVVEKQRQLPRRTGGGAGGKAVPSAILPAVGGLAPAQRRILAALAQLATLGVRRASRANVAVLSDQSAVSSAYGKHVAALCEAGLLTYPAPGELALTEAGRAQAPATTHPPTLADLHTAWQRQLSAPEGAVLRAVIAAHPAALMREALAARAGQSPKSSAFGKHVARLASLGLVSYPEAGTVAATALLFPPGLT